MEKGRSILIFLCTVFVINYWYGLQVYQEATSYLHVIIHTLSCSAIIKKLEQYFLPFPEICYLQSSMLIFIYILHSLNNILYSQILKMQRSFCFSFHLPHCLEIIYLLEFMQITSALVISRRFVLQHNKYLKVRSSSYNLLYFFFFFFLQLLFSEVYF